MLRQAQHERFNADLAIEAKDLVKDFGETRAVDGVSLAVPGRRDLRPAWPQRRRQDDHPSNPPSASSTRPAEAAECSAASAHSRRRSEVGYLPEERGLYPAMHAREAIAFMGALRGLPLAEGRRRAEKLLDEHGLGEWAKKPIRSLSKGMAQTVQLLGTIVHGPRLIVLDEPFAGLDAINQGRLEEIIRREARDRRHHHLLYSCHRPRRAAVRASCDHRQGPGCLRRRGRRGALAAPADRSAAHPRHKGTWRSASPRAPGTKPANGCSSFPTAAPSPCSRH